VFPFTRTNDEESARWGTGRVSRTLLQTDETYV